MVKRILFVGSVLLLTLNLSSCSFEDQVQKEVNDISRQVARDAEKQYEIAKKNGVFQNLLHLGIRKINKTQRKCQHQNKNCVSSCYCCFWDYRPSVATTFLLKLSLCFLSGPTVLWNLIWKDRLLPLFFLFYYIMIVWPPMLNKKQV